MRILLPLLLTILFFGFSPSAALSQQCQEPEVTLPAAQRYCGPTTISFSATNPNHQPVYTANPGGTITKYSWVLNGYEVSTAAYPSINFPTPGTHTISITVTKSCGETATASQQITIDKIPTAPAVESIAVCTGSNATLWVSNPDPNLLYKWYDSNGVLLVWGTSYTKTNVTNTTVYIEALTNTGCTSPRTMATITVSSTNGNATLLNGDQQICAGTVPAMITGNAPQNMTFQWLQSTTNATSGYSPIASAKDKDYTPPALYQTTWFKRIAYNGGCGEETNPVKITVTPMPATPIVSDALVCYGTRATFTVTNNDGNTVYKWYATATSTTLLGTGPTFVTPSPVTGPVSYFVEATTTASTNCFVSSRVEVKANSTPTITNNTISADQAMCTGGKPEPLTGSTPAGGGGGYIYQWQRSTNGSTFTDIPGANAVNYAPASLTTTTWFRRRVKAASTCPETYSNTVLITVTPMPASIDIVEPMICYGSPATMVVTNPDPGFTYSWYDVEVGGTVLATGTSYTTVPLTTSKTYYVEATATSGCYTTRRSVDVTVTALPPAPTAANAIVCEGNSATLAVNPTDATIFYRWYDSNQNLLATGINYNTGPLTADAVFYVEAVTKASPGCASPQTMVQVTVTPAITNNTLTADQAICSGATPAALQGTLPAGGGGGFTYQWAFSEDGSLFQNITGATGKDYAPGALTKTTWFRRTVTASGKCAPSVSNAVKITVNPLPAQPVAQNQNICTGTGTTLQVTSPDANLTYKWYATATGGTALATGTSYNTGILTSNKTYYVEAVSGSGCISTARGMVTVTVTPLPAIPEADNAAICAGSTATLKVLAADANLVYRWYDAETDGTLLATGTNYTTDILSANTTFYLEAATAGGCTSPDRKAVYVTVTPLPAIPDVDNTTVCSGDAAVLFVKNPDPTATYNWYSGGTLLSSGVTFTTDILGSSTTFYVEAVANSSTACTSPARRTVIVTVTPNISNNTIYANQTICSGGTPNTLTGTTPSGGNGTYTYQWERSEDGVNFSSIAGANNASFAPGSLTISTWFRRKVKSSAGSCPEHVSNVIKVTVSPLPVTPAAASITICSGETAKLNITSPDASLTYKWYTSSTGVNPLGVGPSLTTETLTATTTYYVDATSSAGCVSGRRAVTVTVKPQPATPQASDRTICSGQTTTLSVTAPDPTLTYRWYNVNGDLLTTGTTYTTEILTNSTTFFVEASTVTSPVCTSSRKAVVVTVSPIPTTPVASDAAICTGTSTNLTVQSPDVNLIYNWYTSPTGGSAIATGVTFNTGNLTSNRVYYLEAATTAGCVSTRAQVTVTVTPLPATPTAESIAICAGAPATLAVKDPDANLTYRWYTAASGGTLLATGNTYAINSVNGTVTYYVEAVTTGGCASASRGAVTVQVTSLPATPDADNAIICAGDNATLWVKNPEPGLIYRWYESGILVATGISYTTEILGYSATYQLEAVINTITACASPSRRTVSVTVTTPITNNTISANQTICSGSTPAQITGTLPAANGSDFAYQWERSENGTNFTAIANATSQNYSPAALTATTWYRRRVKTASGTCPEHYSNVVQVTVAPIPVTPLADSKTICEGSTTTLKVNTPDATLTYRWYNVATGGSSLATGDSFTTGILSSSVTYYVEAVSANGCSSARKAVAVTVTPTPALPLAEDQTICAGQQATLAVTSPTLSYTYRWYDSGGALLATGTTYTTGVLNSNAIYYVEVTTGGTPACTSGRKAVAVNVTPLPTVPVVNNVTVCSGSPATLTVSTVAPDVTYNWYTVATGGTPVRTGSSYTTNALTSNRTFYVEAVSAYGCISSSRRAVSVTVTPQPAMPVASDQTICAGERVTFTVSSPDATLIYRWYDKNGAPLATGTSYQPADLLYANTTFYVEAATQSSPSCVSPREAVNVTVTPLPAAPAADDARICAGSTATLFVKNATPTIVYNWYDDNETLLSTGTTFTTPVLTADAVYYVEAVTTSGCINQARTLVTAFVSQPISNNTVTANQTICSASVPAKLIGSSAMSGSGTVTYQWESSEDGINYNIIPGATGRDYQPPVTYVTTWFRRVAFVPTGTCPEQKSNIVKVTTIAAPITPQANNITACAGAKATLAVSAPELGYTYRWFSVATGGNSLASGIMYTIDGVQAETTYYVEAVNGSGCVSPRKAVNVFVTPLPSIPQAADKVICSGEHTTLSVNNPDVKLNYRWFDGNGTLVANGSSFQTSKLTQNTVYYVEAYTTTAQACASQRKAVTVSVMQLPTAPEVDNEAICSGTGTTLVVKQASAGLTYKWYSVATGGIALASGTTFETGALTSDRTYFVEAHNGSGCISTRTAVTVKVSQLPATPMAANQAVCAGQTVTLRITQPDAALNYRWYDGAGKLLATGSSHSISGLTASTTYYVEAVTATGCASPTRKAVVVSVAQLPATPAVSNASICSGETVTLFVKNPDPALEYRWYNDAAGTTLIGSGISYTSQEALYSSKSYYIEAVNAAGCISSSRVQANVLVVGKPGLPVADDATVCTGSSATLSVVAPEAELVYKWFDANGTFLHTGTTYTTVPLSSKAIFYVTAFRAIPGTTQYCAGPSEAVTVNISSAISNNTITSGEQTICSGAIPAPLQGSLPSGIGAATPAYQWERSNDGVNYVSIVGAYAQNYAPDALTQDTWFRRRVRVAGPCGESISSAVKITVSPLPATPLADNITICEGSTATLRIKNPATGASSITYRWFYTASGGTAIGSGITFTTQPLRTSTTYYVEAVNATNCASSTRRAVTITVNQLITDNTISTAQTICSGSIPAALTGSVAFETSEPYNYQWQQSTDGGNFTNISGATGQHYAPTEALTRTTWYRRVVRSSGPCADHISNAVKMEVVPLPTVPGIASVSICPGASATLQATGVAAGTRLEWYDAPQGGTYLAEGTTYRATPSVTTSYWVQAVNSNNCESAARQEVKIIVTAPQARISGDVTIMQGKSTKLVASGGATYSWSPATGLTDPTAASPLANPDVTTTYTVTITTPEGCTATASVTVTVVPAIVPMNAMTPNGDGINDVFYVEHLDKYPDCRVEIFTRWGEKIFESKGYDEPWNGTRNGKQLPLGAYYYIIHLSKDEAPISGSITIIK
ncbi:gliding motility-associated C-terminal domain-containing protein [Pontibacter sp. KCTC 32443]|uniref:gliding motility-associated C-terminal domain-containing protein n=1 Tax=Pontibacter TaxID=323449 RepID=UPI00164EA623|nr:MULTISPECIES: gliding motility-associated C-terminal domain-containing protein [Pontibacter]MBC5773791.1 gliding motility-associated C-terminal domain-containing protein [Pontibacter sp. KCTC 32443]